MERQQTKLYFAIWKLKGNEKLQAIKYFISCGEDIHERDKNELTPLHQAVGCGDVEAVKRVDETGRIQRHVEPNEADKERQAAEPFHGRGPGVFDHPRVEMPAAQKGHADAEFARLYVL